MNNYCYFDLIVYSVCGVGDTVAVLKQLYNNINFCQYFIMYLTMTMIISEVITMLVCIIYTYFSKLLKLRFLTHYIFFLFF